MCSTATAFGAEPAPMETGAPARVSFPSLPIASTATVPSAALATNRKSPLGEMAIALGCGRRRWWHNGRSKSKATEKGEAAGAGINREAGNVAIRKIGCVKEWRRGRHGHRNRSSTGSENIGWVNRDHHAIAHWHGKITVVFG